VDDAPEALVLIEREVMDLVAHILDGSERQGNQPQRLTVSSSVSDLVDTI
jgi:hypothetical protein